MTDCFISYSRKDKAFVQQLHTALIEEHRDIWVDWDDIPLTADWWAEIQEGIEATDAVLFVISPASIASEVCEQELKHAVSHNKRLIPVVYRDAGGVHEELARLNWIFMREADDFDAGLTSLLSAMDTDLEWVKEHTRLTQRAVEWDYKNRNESYLLRGDDLADAEMHLSQPEREPVPTELQREYILASQQQQAADLRHELAQAQALADTERKRREEAQAFTAKLRQRMMIIVSALIAVIVLGGFSFIIMRQNGMLATGNREIVDSVVGLADAQTNTDICWGGSLRGLGETVLPACDRAILLDPEEPLYYESRGLAYALIGDFDAATEDFQMAITTALDTGEDHSDKINEWETWLAELQENRNPIHPQLHDQLLREWEEEKDFEKANFTSEDAEIEE